MDSGREWKRWQLDGIDDWKDERKRIWNLKFQIPKVIPRHDLESESESQDFEMLEVANKSLDLAMYV